MRDLETAAGIVGLLAEIVNGGPETIVIVDAGQLIVHAGQNIVRAFLVAVAFEEIGRGGVHHVEIMTRRRRKVEVEHIVSLEFVFDRGVRDARIVNVKIVVHEISVWFDGDQLITRQIKLIILRFRICKGYLFAFVSDDESAGSGKLFDRVFKTGVLAMAAMLLGLLCLLVLRGGVGLVAKFCRKGLDGGHNELVGVIDDAFVFFKIGSLFENIFNEEKCKSCRICCEEQVEQYYKTSDVPLAMFHSNPTLIFSF